jgi:hypothetical protein
MNAKSRVLGLLAAVIMSLSMFGGAVAQSSDSEGVSTVLTGSNAPLCGIDIYAHSGGLGTWVASGGSFVNTAGTSTQEFYGDLVNYQNGCNLSIGFGGLTGPGGLIGTSNFSAYSHAWDGAVDPAGHTVTNTAPWGGFWDFSYTLNTVPSTLTAGTYSGTISATVSNAA